MTAVNNGRLKRDAVDLLGNEVIGIINSVYKKRMSNFLKQLLMNDTDSMSRQYNRYTKVIEIHYQYK